MKKLLILLVLSVNLFAVDEFNTYRWNRGNLSNTEKGPWFEWWYYKIVDPKTDRSFYFVYGVVNPWDINHTNKASRAYVGMGDFVSMVNFDETFPVSDFSASYDEVLVKVSDNLATDNLARGEIIGENGNRSSWNFTIQKNWSFNATGWLTGKNITNIEWYPAQADATCTGEVTVNGLYYSFEDALCYQDRNWGRSFPKWWTWIVSNNFVDHSETALAIGGGRPKVFGRFEPIEGVAIGLRHEGKEYKFRPNDLEKVTIDINFGKWEVVGESLKYKIEVSAWAPKEKFMDLKFMTPTGEVFHDYETLTGDLDLKLYQRRNIFSSWELIAALKSHHAGIEYGSRESYDLLELFNSSASLYK